MHVEECVDTWVWVGVVVDRTWVTGGVACTVAVIDAWLVGTWVLVVVLVSVIECTWVLAPVVGT